MKVAMPGATALPVAFHFNAPDALAYACRFIRKALRHDARVTVVVDAPLAPQLSQQLWKQSAQDFLAHAAQGSAQTLAFTLAPVVLVQQPAASPHRDILLNLCTAMPEGYTDFARVVEIVSTDADARAHARQRWRNYQAQGCQPMHYDVSGRRAA